MSLKTTLITVVELAALSPQEVLVVDCRFDLADPDKSARDYRDGHIPGAVYASLDNDLSDLARQVEGLGRHPLPLEQAFSALLSRWGWQRGLPAKWTGATMNAQQSQIAIEQLEIGSA